MKLAIMQPYFLPYIGYFQLINAVDKFVIYDDVTFIKQGWINRNRIILNDKDFLFTLELKGASSFKEINKVEVGKNRLKLMKTFYQAYQKAPYFEEVRPILNSILNSLESNLSKYLFYTIELINDYLGIKTKLLISSEIDKNNTLRGQEKVIEICKNLDASIYINSIGGKELYSKTDFAASEIDLFFLQPYKIEYLQFRNKFIPWLSIIDVMMFNSKEEINTMLSNYELV